MFPNGQFLVIDMAVRALGDPLASRYREAMVLGALREDVYYVPLAGIVFEHLSVSHFYRPGLPGGLFPFVWPGPRFHANRFYAKALAEFRAGRTASAFVQLGRSEHFLIDMACPVHAQRVIHELDPFEWWCEAHVDELRRLPVPSVADSERPSDLVHALAVFAQDFEADATNTVLGRRMFRLGRWKKVDAATAGRQARELVPAAAGHTVALLRMFLREVA